MKNREIKFRFWDKDLKKMFYRKPLCNDFNHKDIIPLEFTGFKGIRGIEIYDGDLLIERSTTLEEGVRIEDTAQQVYWCLKLGCWKLDNTFYQNKESGYLLANELKDFKYTVIGNVFQK